MKKVPIIDLAAAEEDVSVLEPLDRACRDHGFFLLSNHGMDKEIEAMWRNSELFFNDPRSEKSKLLRTKEKPLGYYNKELTKRKRDLKEVFDFMGPRNDKSERNQWPDNKPEFKQVMDDFFSAATLVAERTLNLVYRALTKGNIDLSKLPSGDGRTSTVRLNCYPTSDPLEIADRADVANLGDMALHHHTDPGILTLLLQDMIGGLQARSSDDGWIDVPPVEGVIVVNLGDSMQVWTNDVYKSAIHRVLPMKGNTRYSTPYFYSPARDAILEPLPLLQTGSPRYTSFTWKEYIQGRIDDNYTDLGEDDIQISRFSIAG
ncbi:MAG: 2OG-Fe(II) oxygenase family protein [Pseudomonadales bacterium]